MRNQDYTMMTNRELDTEYRYGKKAERYFILVEMAKRLGRIMITSDILPEFRHWKLNGGGMDRY